MSNKGLQPVSSDCGGTLYEGDFVAAKVDKSKIGTISEQLHLVERDPMQVTVAIKSGDLDTTLSGNPNK